MLQSGQNGKLSDITDLQTILHNIFEEILNTEKIEFGEGIESGVSACTVVVGNSVLLIGGKERKKQISQVHPGGIRRIRNLPFNFNDGRCTFFKKYVYLCFPETDLEKCYIR